jgi:hypothetical protein
VRFLSRAAAGSPRGVDSSPPSLSLSFSADSGISSTSPASSSIAAPGHVAEALLHQPAHLELNGALLGDGDGLEGLGVLGLAGLAELGLEHAEIAELQAVAATELVDDLVKELLRRPSSRARDGCSSSRRSGRSVLFW